MGLLANGLSQCIGESPASLKAPTNCLLRYPCDLSPFCHPQAFSVPCQETAGSFISCLLFCGRPATVLRRVALVVLDAVNRVMRAWTRAHVFEERLEGIFPARAHRNAATAVVAPAGIIEIIATLDHGSPSSILTALVHSVLGIAQPDPLFVKATTASRGSINQSTRTNDDGFPAGTAAQPSIASEFHSDWFDRRQLSELLIGEIAKRRHTHIIAESRKICQQETRRSGWVLRSC